MFEFLDQKIIWDENLEKEIEFQEFIDNKLVSDSFYNLPKGENLDSLAFQTKQMRELNISNSQGFYASKTSFFEPKSSIFNYFKKAQAVEAWGVRIDWLNYQIKPEDFNPFEIFKLA